MRVLVVRTSALGDIVHALPTLAALRRHRPTARIAWVVDEVFAPLLEGHADLERVIVAPLRRARRSGQRAGGARDLLRFVARLRAFRAEVALDLMGNHKGALIARVSGAPRRLGLDRAGRREASSALWINEPVDSSSAHAVDRMLDVARALGLPAEPPDFTPDRLACGRDRLAPGEFAFIHPGAAWGNKGYPPARWGETARGLAARTGLEVRVGAAPGEEALADGVAAASGGVARRVDLPDIPSLVGTLRSARLVLAGDTGALHLADALGRPVVGVYGPTDPARHGPRSGSAAVVFERLPCSFCHQRMEVARPCLLSIDPDEIVARAAALVCGAALD